MKKSSCFAKITVNKRSMSPRSDPGAPLPPRLARGPVPVAPYSGQQVTRRQRCNDGRRGRDASIAKIFIKFVIKFFVKFVIEFFIESFIKFIKTNSKGSLLHKTNKAISKNAASGSRLLVAGASFAAAKAGGAGGGGSKKPRLQEHRDEEDLQADRDDKERHLQLRRCLCGAALPSLPFSISTLVIDTA